MTPVHAIVLGIVQGLTEFLPVSSKTHLVVVPALLRWPEPSLEFVVFLHIGTTIAVLAYFSRDLWRLAVGFVRGADGARRTVLLLAVASVPATVVGLVFESTVERLLKHTAASALALVITALILVGAEWASGTIGGGRRLPRPLRDQVEPRDAAGMGLAQALALFPGISRSGSTMGAGLSLGLSRPAAARFSFLMAIPVIAGANVLELPKIVHHGIGAPELAGFLTSLIAGLLAVWGLLRWLQRHTFLPFAAYCVVFGVGAAIRLR